MFGSRLAVGILAIVVLSLLSACGGSSTPVGVPDPLEILSVTPSQPMVGNQAASLTVRWQGGNGPYTLSFNLGNAAASPEDQVVAASPFVLPIQLANVAQAGGSNYLISVVLTDANGVTVAQERSIQVLQTFSATIEIFSTRLVGNVLTVEANDTLGLPLSVKLVESPGVLTSLPSSRTVVDSRASFTVLPADLQSGYQGTLSLELATPDGRRSYVNMPGLTLPGLDIPADTLCAIPLASEAQVGDEVKVVVATGPLSHPLQFMTSVGMLIPMGCRYSGSFDFGMPTPGDRTINPLLPPDPEHIDGFWAYVGPKFFLSVGGSVGKGARNLIGWPPDLQEPYENYRLQDFNVTPLSAHDAPVGSAGVLFNFNLKCDAPGTYQLGFLPKDYGLGLLNYYQDGSQAVYEWADISNQNPLATLTVR